MNISTACQFSGSTSKNRFDHQQAMPRQGPLHHPAFDHLRRRQPNARRRRSVFLLGSLQAFEIGGDDRSGQHRHIKQAIRAPLLKGTSSPSSSVMPDHPTSTSRAMSASVASSRLDGLAQFTQPRLAHAQELTIKGLPLVPATINRHIEADRPRKPIVLLQNERHQVNSISSSSLPASVGVAIKGRFSIWMPS
jgi:hypothetical protein